MNLNKREAWLEKVEEIASEVCQREGCRLYDLEFSGTNQGRTLRVYVDKDGGASIDDCSNVSKGLNLLLDVDDLVPGGAYNLEVSTPGLDRQLRLKWHFEAALGKKIRIRAEQALESYGVVIERFKKAKQVEEVLSAVEGEELNFDVKEGALRIPLAAIEKAKVVFEMTKGTKKK